MHEYAFHLADLALPASPDGDPAPVLSGILDLEREDALATMGYDDTVTLDLGVSLARHADQSRRVKVRLVALRGERPADATEGRFPGVRSISPVAGEDDVRADDVVGITWLGIPLEDNTHMLEQDPVYVRPDWRGHGIGSALMAEAERIGQQYERSTFLSWTTCTPVPAGEGTLPDPTGTIHVSTSEPTVSYALRYGYRFAQAERHSLQRLPMDPETLGLLLAEAEAAADGYELVSWRDRAPDDLVDDLAALASLMSTDPPLGEVDWRPEVWDADRFRHAEENAIRANHVFGTAARHIESGRLVGYTEVGVPRDREGVAFQQDTIIDSAHRGHKLGLWVKARNVELLQNAFPGVQRVHTWNADENSYMLAINTALRYRQESIDACWQRVIG